MLYMYSIHVYIYMYMCMCTLCCLLQLRPERVVPLLGCLLIDYCILHQKEEISEGREGQAGQMGGEGRKKGGRGRERGGEEREGESGRERE